MCGVRRAESGWVVPCKCKVFSLRSDVLINTMPMHNVQINVRGYRSIYSIVEVLCKSLCMHACRDQLAVLSSAAHSHR